MPTPLTIARDAALAGGAVLSQRTADVGEVRSKSAATDFVTDADIAAGIATVRAILAHDPRARIVVEEPEVCEQLGVEPGSLLDDDSVWVVDPLDGTTSYLHGFPCYSVARRAGPRRRAGRRRRLQRRAGRARQALARGAGATAQRRVPSAAPEPSVSKTPSSSRDSPTTGARRSTASSRVLSSVPARTRARDQARRLGSGRLLPRGHGTCRRLLGVRAQAVGHGRRRRHLPRSRSVGHRYRR